MAYRYLKLRFSRANPRLIGTQYCDQVSSYECRYCLHALRQLNGKDYALLPYVYLRLGKCQGLTPLDREVFLKKAIDLASRLINPHNFLVAESNRQIAWLYLDQLSSSIPSTTVNSNVWDGSRGGSRVVQRAPLGASLESTEVGVLSPVQLDEWRARAEAALAIDARGAGLDSQSVQEDEWLLAHVFTTLRDYDKADYAWSEYVRISRILDGADSLEYACALCERALFQLKLQRINSSLDLVSPSLEIWSKNFNRMMWEQDRLIELMTSYFSALHEGVGQSEAVRLEDRFLLYYQTAMRKQLDPFRYCRRKSFDLLFRYADEYQSSGNLNRAQDLYMQALKLGRQFMDTSCAEYVLCMAKAAHNYQMLGDNDQALAICKNCLAITDPFRRWMNRPDYSKALGELVCVVGAIPKDQQNAQTQEMLKLLYARLISAGRHV